MVFSDLFFLYVFLPAFALCYAAAGAADRLRRSPEGAPACSVRNLTLALFSLVFYAWGEPVYVFLMLLCVAMNYAAGLLVDRCTRRRRAALAAGVAGNVAVLGLFKYAGFACRSLAALGLDLPEPHIALPIGISFYTFQSISYLVDVYRREAPCQRRLGGLLLYISMFPQLIAGPIVRYDAVAREITQRRASAADVADGVFRFLVGLGKKVVLANQLSEISTAFLAGGAPASTLAAWTGIAAFTLQIYFDFSGYSDMAIGLGRCLGFHFPENFRHPYCCTSVTDFWRRWHISLGSFFRDYVYIPMGGNRRHQGLNIMTVWLLTGLWHGASWNFVLWGLWFGVIVTLEKYTLLRVAQRIPRVLLHVYSLTLVVAGWGLFYFEDFAAMRAFFAAICGLTGDAADFAARSALTDSFWLWVAALLCCLPLRRAAATLTDCLPGGRLLRAPAAVLAARLVLSVALLAASTALLVGATNNAFIYTRF